VTADLMWQKTWVSGGFVMVLRLIGVDILDATLMALAELALFFILPEAVAEVYFHTKPLLAKRICARNRVLLKLTLPKVRL